MTLAVSNIAWQSSDESAVADRLEELGVRGVEIAPTKVFPNPLDVSDDEIAAYQQFWRQRGVKIVAFQSMLFGRDDLKLFLGSESREKTLAHLMGFVRLAGRMNVEVLVFGSPQNRRLPEGMTTEDAWSLAVEVFQRIGSLAADNGTTFCIEPNPPSYQCNFITNAREGIDLVDAVGNPGFALHLDAAGMTLAGDDIGASIAAAGSRLRHFHASAPWLGLLEEVIVDHAAAAAALKRQDYKGVVSIEMRSEDSDSPVSRVSRSVHIAQRHYGF
jgi:sugar phosphate isomerase/epimerase